MTPTQTKIIALLRKTPMCFQDIADKFPDISRRTLQSIVWWLKHDERIILVGEVRRPPKNVRYPIYGLPANREINDPPHWLYPHVATFNPALVRGSRDVRVD